MMKRILVGLAFCAAASPAFAEDGGLVGKLVTPNGTPIKGYPVVVSGKTECGIVQDWISATDSTATFMVNALPPGQYTFAPANEPSATTSFPSSRRPRRAQILEQSKSRQERNFSVTSFT